MPIFDTHAHYDADRFDSDRDALLSAMPGVGVGLVLDPGCDLPSSRAAAELAGVPGGGGCGLRPVHLLDRPKVVAIGEIGLDYYWEDNPPRAFQQTVFRKQLALAAELDLPVIVHDREAHGDCLAIIREFPTVTGVFHCFSGSPEMAAELLKRGWYLGFDGPITYKNAKRAPEVAAITPLDRMVVETDAPYMAPVPMRGKRNDSRYLPYVIEKLAEWKGVTAEEMTRVTWENGRRLFRI